MLRTFVVLAFVVGVATSASTVLTADNFDDIIIKSGKVFTAWLYGYVHNNVCYEMSD